jgi:hypothetical protein
MRTDDLINALARETEPQSRLQLPGAALRALAAGLAVGVALVVIFLNIRPDIGVALPVVLAKAGFSGLASAAAIPLLLQLSRPGRAPGWRIAGLIGFFVLAFLIAAVGLLGEAPGDRMSAWTGGKFPWCVATIPVLAAPAGGFLFWLMRDLAPTQLGLTGASLGAAAGGIGAMSYAMYCPMDSQAFVATWYGVAIGLCAAVGALVGTRFMRW